MIKEILGDLSSAALTKSLEARSQRQDALASNVANVDTPATPARTSTSRARCPTPSSSRSTADEMRPRPSSRSPHGAFRHQPSPSADGNNVSIEHEMAELARNSLEFDSSARMLSLKIRMLRAAISEGRK